MSRSVSCLRCWWRGRGRDRVRLGRMVVAAASVVVVRGDRLVDRLGRGLDERRARVPYWLYWYCTQNDHFLIIALMHLVDRVLGEMNYFQNTVIFFYLANESCLLLRTLGEWGYRSPVPA